MCQKLLKIVQKLCCFFVHFSIYSLKIVEGELGGGSTFAQQWLPQSQVTVLVPNCSAIIYLKNIYTTATSFWLR